MRTLIIGDSHIADKYIDELEYVFEEILEIDADKCIHLGDFFDNNKLSPRELEFGTKIAKEFKEKYKDFTIMSGNGRHEWLNSRNITSYLKDLNVNTVGMEYKIELDNLQCYFGHFMTNQSILEYGSAEVTISELSKYDLAILGHQHLFQEIKKDKIYHLGSIFFQNFNEAKEDYKRVALIENGKLEFIKLNAPINMVDLESVSELSKFTPDTKIRLIYKSFEDWKRDVNHLTEYKNKFVDFKIKLDFTSEPVFSDININKQPQKVDEIINQELDKIEDPEVKALLKSQYEEVKNGNV